MNNRNTIEAMLKLWLQDFFAKKYTNAVSLDYMANHKFELVSCDDEANMDFYFHLPLKTYRFTGKFPTFKLSVSF